MNVALTAGFLHMISRSGHAIKVDTDCCRHHMDHAIVIVAEIAQKSRQHGRGMRFGVVKQDDSPAGDFEPSGDQLQFLSLAHRSAPNTTMPRDCSRSSVAGVDSKPGKRKNGVLGTVVATP